MNKQELIRWLGWLKSSTSPANPDPDIQSSIASWMTLIEAHLGDNLESYLARLKEPSRYHLGLGIASMGIYLYPKDILKITDEVSSESEGFSPSELRQYIAQAFKNNQALIISAPERSDSQSESNNGDLNYLVPLLAPGGYKLGVAVFSPAWHNFTPDTLMKMYQAISFRIAAWLKFLGEVQDIKKSNEADQAILDMAVEISHNSDYNSLFHSIVRFAARALSSQRASLFIHDEINNELWSWHADGADGQIRIPTDKGLVGSCFQTQKSIRVDDLYRDSRFNPAIDQKTGFRSRNTIVVPIFIYTNNEAAPGAVLQVLNKTNGLRYTSEDQKRLERVGGVLSIALEKAHFFEMLGNNDAIVVY